MAGVECLRISVQGLTSFIEFHGRKIWNEINSNPPASDPSLLGEYYNSTHNQQVPPPDPEVTPIPKCTGTAGAPIVVCNGCICDAWAVHIQQRHDKCTKGRMGWGNSKTSSWNGTEDDYFEVLKAFCGIGGYKSSSSPDQGDATLLGNIISWCQHSHAYVVSSKATEFTSARSFCFSIQCSCSVMMNLDDWLVTPTGQTVMCSDYSRTPLLLKVTAWQMMQWRSTQ